MVRSALRLFRQKSPRPRRFLADFCAPVDLKVNLCAVGVSRGAAVYDIAEFDKFTNPATVNSPVPNAAFSLTVAKVKAFATPVDYEPLNSVAPIKVTFNGKGKGPAHQKKRKRDDGSDEDDDDSDGDGSGSGSQ